MNTIQVDETQRELRPHGTPQFPVEINHDDLRDFQNFRVRCHWHEEFEISIVQEGQASYRLGEGEYLLSPGQGILINSRIPHTTAPCRGQAARLLTLIVHPAFLYGSPESAIALRLIRPFQCDASLPCVPLTEELVSLFREIDQLAGERPFGYELKIKGLFCEGFFQLISRCQPLTGSLRDGSSLALGKLERLLAHLHAHFNEPLSLERLAKEISFTPGSCCRFFKQMTGQTISQYLEDYRISQSLSLLGQDQFSIAQVAALSGFSNPGRFSKAFSQRMLCTPGQYRRKMRACALHTQEPDPKTSAAPELL